ncbi:F0F1 ATP synthase subunit delta [Mycoplasma procyoni]|uniref:F0F1 ATP synthase subunit delta n=1 Tax=Mycoplasma procyoni TaxID=568784 RepID=UPI00197B4ACA|nr:F0F1 ATP synthase subunit delta [Mycoplasma procyoni]MBN3534531.1 F0F1 ATP synthase subunit delta [Mycoplasma procyoni]
MISNDNHLNYSRALFDIALEENKLDKYYKQSLEVLDIFKNQQELIDFLRSFSIEQESKEEVITNVFLNELKFEEFLVNFLKLITKKHRILQINEIILDFEKIVLKHKNIAKGVVYSTKKVSKEKMAQIIEFVSKKLNQEVILENIIDQSLIAGIKIVIGDKIFENTIVSQLQQIKEHILKGGE